MFRTINLIIICLSVVFSDTVFSSFCSEPTIDTAFSYGKHTILIRKNQIWFYDIQTKSVSSEAFPLNEVIRDNRLKSIDSVFVSNNSSNDFEIVYIFSNNKYYLLKPIESIDKISSKAPVVFQPLDVKTDAQFVPKKWSVSGDIPLNEVLHNNTIWFPRDIDEAVVLKNVELYLFHSNSIRWTIITDNWPQGKEYEFPFVGPLKGLHKIDAVFRVANDERNDIIIIIEGNRYCQFQRTETNISINIKRSCKWKDITELFICQNKTTIENTETTTSLSTTSLSTTYLSTTSLSSTLVTTSSTPREAKNETKDSYSSNQRKGFTNSSGFVIIVIFIVLILLITGSLIVIFSVISYQSRKKYDTSKSQNSGSSQMDGFSSVVTLDSNTGLKK